MPPTTDQATVALAYESGIQVTFVPWVYGVSVQPFSQEANAKSYEIAASQDEGYTTGTIAGIPVRVTAYSEDLGPGSVEFNLGTSNADAQTIAVIGNSGQADLESVAASIIKRGSKPGKNVAPRSRITLVVAYPHLCGYPLNPWCFSVTSGGSFISSPPSAI
jgi:hypothetical protein